MALNDIGMGQIERTPYSDVNENNAQAARQHFR